MHSTRPNNCGNYIYHLFLLDTSGAIVTGQSTPTASESISSSPADCGQHLAIREDTLESVAPSPSIDKQTGEFVYSRLLIDLYYVYTSKLLIVVNS